jgi:hypothetical protein
MKISNPLKVLCLLVCSALCLSGCLSVRKHAAGIEPLARALEQSDFEDLGESDGESSSFILLWLIPVTRPLSYDAAVDDAISKKDGDNLINVRSWIERQYWVMGTVQVLRVKGSVIRYRR